MPLTEIKASQFLRNGSSPTPLRGVGGAVRLWSRVNRRGAFRSVYEYDFVNLVLMFSMITFHTNLVPIVSYSTARQQGGVRTFGICNWIEIRK